VEYRPEYYAVLEAIARGIDTAEKISERVGLEWGEVERILKHLEISGLVARVRKGLIFKREAYMLTPAGWRRLDEWRDRARADIERAYILRREGDEPAAMEILTPYIAVLPFLLTLDHMAVLEAQGLLRPLLEAGANEREVEETSGLETHQLGLEEGDWEI